MALPNLTRDSGRNLLSTRSLGGPSVGAPGNAGNGGGCSGGSCGIGKGRKSRARTRPYGIASQNSVIGAQTMGTAAIPVKLPSGTKLRMSGTVLAQAGAITAIAVDGTNLNLGPGGIPATALDVQATAGEPLDFILPAINTSLQVTFASLAVAQVSVYLENVPLTAVQGCEVADDGADAS